MCRSHWPCVSLGAQHRRGARRDDDGGRPSWLPARSRLIGRLAVIGAVDRGARDPDLDLREQVRYSTGIISLVAGQEAGDDLALAEQLEPSTVEQQVQRPVRHHLRWSSSKTAAAPAQGGVVWNAELDPEQPARAADEALGLAQGELEGQPQRQHQLDRQVRGAGLAARRRP